MAQAGAPGGGAVPGGGAAQQFLAIQPAQLAALADMLRGGGGATRLRRMTEATPGAWLEHRRHFTKVVELQNWDDLRQRRELAASIQEKAGNAILDIDVANFATIDALIAEIATRFMPVAAGATARSNYYSARQLPTESAREWHTRLRELFHLAYPNDNPNDHPQCMDLFVTGLHNSSVKFFVGSQHVPDFNQALTIAERSETAFKREKTQQGGINALTMGLNAMDVGGARTGLACYFCSDMFNVTNAHTKSNCPYWKAAKQMYYSENGAGTRPNPSGAGPALAIPNGRSSNQRRFRRNGRGSKPKRAVNAVTIDPPVVADSSDEDAGN